MSDEKNIVDATNAITHFFKKNLNKTIINVVKTSVIESGWEGRVEVVEENEAMKAIGKKIMRKYLYYVALDKDLNIISYDRDETIH